MKLTESDIYLLTARGGWTADRAVLSAGQVDALVAIAGHQVPAHRRADFGWALNQRFAQLVSDLGQRSGGLGHQNASRSGPSEGHPPVAVRCKKLSTMVWGELDGVRRATRDTTSAIEGLSPASGQAIRAFFWKARLVGATRVSLVRRFRRTWVGAHEAFMVFQAACERCPEQVGTEVSHEAQAELLKVSEFLDDLGNTIEGIHETTWGVLESSFDARRRAGLNGFESSVTVADPIGDALAWLSLLRSVAEHPRIEVKRGREEVALKNCVVGLAALYQSMVGKEPSRAYRAIETRRSGRKGETGKFLELARKLVGYACELLPEAAVPSSRSLSKIVRLVLEERKAKLSA